MTMSNDENFLARWSRRKRGRTIDSRSRPKPNLPGGNGAAAPSPAGETRPLFDPATLPSIESLGADSDVRAFLAVGVPAELTRAALRRAWSADPAIRDFIGLSENSWDFNAPGGVPGFGSLTAEDVSRLVTQVLGESEASDRPASLAAESPMAPVRDAGAAPDEVVPEDARQDPDAAADRGELTQGREVNVAMQHDLESDASRPLVLRRSHGSALPNKVGAYSLRLLTAAFLRH
jgi:hypothetical protein